MKVQAINNNKQQNKPNFQALKAIKFGESLQFNDKAKIELLKMFDYQPIKDVFTKYDGNVKFTPLITKKDIHSAKGMFGEFASEADIGILYSIVCELNLKNNISKLILKFKDFAQKEQVNIDSELESYVQNREGEVFKFAKGNFFVIDEYKECENIQELDKAIEKNNQPIANEEDFFDIGPLKYNQECLKNMRDIYQKNPDEMKNQFLFAAYDFIDHVKQLDSNNIEELIPEVVKSDVKVKKDLNKILQEAVRKKNVEDKLKELLGENYIPHREQSKIDVCKKHGVKITKPIYKAQEVEEIVVNKGRKNKKPIIKKD